MEIMKLASDQDLSFEKLSPFKKAEELLVVKAERAVGGSRKKEWDSTPSHWHVPDTPASFIAIQQADYVHTTPL